MSAATGMAFVIVQHLSPDFKSLMGELLARKTPIPIRQVEDGMPVEPDCIYLLPARKEMILAAGRLLLTDKDPGSDLALPIDIFFRSLARDAGRNAIGVILSGTGSDGSRGIRAIHEAGGLVISQSLDSAKFDGMPKNAQDTHVVDLVLGPEDIPSALLQHVGLDAMVDAETSDPAPAKSGMDIVFALLQGELGIDFSDYKANTVMWRVERRVLLRQEPGPGRLRQAAGGGPRGAELALPRPVDRGNPLLSRCGGLRLSRRACASRSRRAPCGRGQAPPVGGGLCHR
jgi:two-component system, chemotaxis family, CheB/CheR fusion protein